MDAGKWAEAEPGQDGGPEGGCPFIGGLGNSVSFEGVTLTAKSEVRSLGIHLDQALTMEIKWHQWSALPISICGRLPSCVPILMLEPSPFWSMLLQS